MFARLAELDLAAAEKAHAKLMAAEETSDIAELGRTYQRMARSLRQTLALKAKLARERETPAARPPRPEFGGLHEELRVVTSAQRAKIERVHTAVWPFVEAERPDWDDLDEAELYEILIEMAHERADFVDAPIEPLVAKVREIMELHQEPLTDDDDPPLAPQPEPAVQDSA